MKTCKDCGRETKDRAQFCPACGSRNLIAIEESVDDRVVPEQEKRIPWGKYVAVTLVAVVVIGIAVMVTIILTEKEGGEKSTDIEEVEVYILKPGDNSTTYIDSTSQGTVDLDVELACEGRPEKILVYLDDQIKATLVEEPYACSIKGVKEGSYVIRAEAEGGDEEILASSNIKITIARPGEEQAEETDTPTPESSEYGYFYTITMQKHHNAEYSYTISCPVGWTRDEEIMDYGYRTKWWSPDRSMYFLVDSSRLKTSEVDPCDTAYSLDREFTRAGTPGYVNYGINRETFKGWPSCRYELGYVSSEDDFFTGQDIRKFDYFVIGSVNGYAILFAARPDVYERNIQSFIEMILNSFEPES